MRHSQSIFAIAIPRKKKGCLFHKKTKTKPKSKKTRKMSREGSSAGGSGSDGNSRGDKFISYDSMFDNRDLLDQFYQEHDAHFASLIDEWVSAMSIEDMRDPLKQLNKAVCHVFAMISVIKFECSNNLSKTTTTSSTTSLPASRMGREEHGGWKS